MIDVQTKILDREVCSQLEGGNGWSTRDCMSRAELIPGALYRRKMTKSSERTSVVQEPEGLSIVPFVFGLYSARY